MFSYINPTKKEQQLMDKITIPPDSCSRVQTKFFKSVNSKKAKWTFGVSTLVLSGALAVFIFAFTMSPKLNGNTNLSFLEVAHAAYADMAAKIDEAYPVRHTITESTTVGTINGPVTEKNELWSLIDGSKTFAITQSSLRTTSEDNNNYFARADGVSYVSSERAEQFALSIDESDIVVFNPTESNVATYNSTDSALTIESGNNYVLAMPQDSNGITQALDPLDPKVECFKFDKKSEDQLNREALMSQLRESVGYDSENNFVDPKKITELLLEGKSAGLVEDLGEYQDDKNISQHWFRVVVDQKLSDPADSLGFDTTQTTTFGFDVTNYRLLTIITTFDDGLGNVYTDTTKIITDEFVSLADANPGLMNPEGQGLVKLEPNPIESWPSYPITDGCYRQGTDHPEKLSSEEEAAVWARIESNDIENKDEYNSDWVDELNHPPEITLSESGKIHHGLEGSYCFGGICVDKISPIERMKEIGESFQIFEGTSVTINFGEIATSVAVDMFSVDGKIICSANPIKITDKEYKVDLCADEPGEYILTVGENIVDGDIIYNFPIIIDQVRE